MTRLKQHHNSVTHIFCNLVCVLFLSTAISIAYAEVVLDGTLGFQGTLEGPDYKIGAELGQQHDCE